MLPELRVNSKKAAATVDILPSNCVSHTVSQSYHKGSILIKRDHPGSMRDITTSTLSDSGQCYNLDTIAKQGVSLAVYTFVYMCMYIMFINHYLSNRNFVSEMD